MRDVGLMLSMEIWWEEYVELLSISNHRLIIGEERERDNDDNKN